MAKLFTFHCFSAIFLLSLMAGKGLCECTHTYKDIEVSQAPTGQIFNRKTEYQVTLTSNCDCNHLQVKLSCPGFKTVKPVDPKSFSFAGGVGIVPSVDGEGRPTVFKYTWDFPFTFTPIASQVACS
ncbi:hypothetical protein ACHQM5_021977 [Ranunculus cassubicifolius]